MCLRVTTVAQFWIINRLRRKPKTHPMIAFGSPSAYLCIPRSAYLANCNLFPFRSHSRLGNQMAELSSSRPMSNGVEWESLSVLFNIEMKILWEVNAKLTTSRSDSVF